MDIEKLRGVKQSQLSHYLDSIFEERFSAYGKWNNAPIYRILMSLIRKRPRDLVKLCTLAAKDAYDERLLLNMKPSRNEIREHKGYIYDTNRLKQKIKNIIEQGKFIYTNGVVATDTDLLQFMYKINFITARKDMPNGLIERKYFEENRYLSNSFTNFGYGWEIHPAFRWALSPDSVESVFAEIDLSSDDM